MCRLGRTAGSAAEMSDVHCGVPDFVDGSRRGDARRDAPAPDAGDLVPGLGAFARHPVGGGTDAFGELCGKSAGRGYFFVNALAGGHVDFREELALKVDSAKAGVVASS
jgi:hypothetical protein